MANQLTIRDIIELRNSFPNENLLVFNTDAVRKNKSENHPTSYVPILIKTKVVKNGKIMLGKPRPIYIKFQKVICCSSAKIPAKKDAETAKYLQIVFRYMDNDDLSKTDYQKEKWPILQKSQEEFVKAMKILNEEYVKLIKKEVESRKGCARQYRQGKTIFQFEQTMRKRTKDELEALLNDAIDDEEDEDVDADDDLVPLDYPMYRIRLNIDFYNTKKFGYMTKKNGFKYTVYDGRKRREKRFVPARIKQPDGTLEELTAHNAHEFITYASLSAGVIQFREVCFSGSGISAFISFNQLHIYKHNRVINDSIDDKDFDEMDELSACTNKETEANALEQKKIKEFVEDTIDSTPANQESVEIESDDDIDEGFDDNM